MVSLVIEAPLAEHNVGARVLYASDHIGKVGLLHLLKALIVSGSLDLETMLGLWLGWLEWARQDAHLSILSLLGHLRVGELLVDDDALDEAGVLDGAASLGNDLDQVEVDITTIQIGDVEDGAHSEVSVVLLALADDLGAEGGLGALSQLRVVVLEDVELLLDFIDSADSDVTGLLETIGDFEWVDALLQKFLSLLEDGASENDNTGGSVTDLVVLRGAELGQETGSLVMNLHLLKDGCTIIGDDDLSVRAEESKEHMVSTR